MNTYNQKLLKGIKIFFKILYIIVIIFFVFGLLSQIMSFLIPDISGLASLPYLYVDHEPEVNLALNGKGLIASDIFAIGIINVTDVSLIYKILSGLFSTITLFLFVVILKKVKSIIHSIEQTEVFSILNANRLKAIGWLLLLVLAESNTIILLINPNAEEFTLMGKMMMSIMLISDSIGMIVAIVFTFFMAAVFKIGVNMQEENQSFV